MKKIIVLLFILTSLQLSAQKNEERIKIGGGAGYSFFKQDDLKSINKNIITQLPFDANIIDDFGPSIFFGAYAMYSLKNRFHIGPAYEYHYSGSRLGIKDYSGTFSFDQYIHNHQIGLKVDYSLFLQPKTAFKIELDAGANLTDWKMESKLIVGDNDYSEQQQEHLKGLSWYVSPVLKNDFCLLPQLYLVGTIGYIFDLFKNYHLVGKNAVDVVETPNWSGLKMYLGFEFNF